jgi:hypothetical protein
MNISTNKPGIGDVPDLYPIFTYDQKPVPVFKRDCLDRSAFRVREAERAVELEKLLISLSKDRGGKEQAKKPGVQNTHLKTSSE